ncbi:MAG TPA: serine protease [Rudaea sp.]|nr:serine protease [Rudaea sp.]
MRTLNFIASLLAGFCAASLALAWPASAAENAETIFASAKDRILQVRLIDQAGNAKNALGSGFVIAEGGRVISNYHVVSGLVNHPGRFRAEYLTQGGDTGRLELLDIDVVHDLALLRAAELPEAHFTVRAQAPVMGERLYSLGNPLDLGLTIVEGTYNGLLKKSLYERIHFTGSINPGMSGGPTLDGNGQVIGVNVATAGNQVSFLVPAKYVSELLARGADKPMDAAAFDATVAGQLLANQQRYVGTLLGTAFAETALGGYSVPGQIADYVNCWGHTDREPRRLYHSVSYSCSTDENIFLSDELSSGAIHFSHRLWSTDDLGVLHFFHLLQNAANGDSASFGGNEESAGNFRCRSGFVEHAGLVSKTVYCMRRYKQFEGLYDVYEQAITLHDDHEALESTLTLSGVSAANAAAFASKFVEDIAWKP